MVNEFIPYKQALSLKELGFRETCFSFFTEEGDLYESEGWGYTCGKNVLGNEVAAPLYQQAFRWFRKKYELDHYIKKSYDFKKYFYTITKDGIIIGGTDAYDIADSYEEAEQLCLEKIIQILNETIAFSPDPQTP